MVRTGNSMTDPTFRPEQFDAAVADLRQQFAGLLAAGGQSAEAIASTELALAKLSAAADALRSRCNALELARQVNNDHYRRLFEFAPDAYLVTDRHGNILEANRAAAQLLAPRKHLPGHALDEFVAAAQRARFRTRLRQLATGETGRWETRLQPGGAKRQLEVRVHAEADAEQLRFMLEDVTPHKIVEQQLRVAARVVETSTEGVVITDADGRIQLLNRAMAERIDGDRAALQGKSLENLLPDVAPAILENLWRNVTAIGHWQGEVWLRQRGKPVREWLMINATTDRRGRLTHYVAIFSDLSRRHALSAPVFRLAHHDPLTDLPNRELLFDRMQVGLAHSGREGALLAVVFLDIDRFAQINADFGHRAGDEVLRQLAERLRTSVRKGDSVARVGGDRFAALLPLLSGVEDGIRIAEKIIAELSRPLAINGRELTVATSLGISLYPRDGSEPGQLLERAEEAMSRAKKAGGGRYRIYGTAFDAAPWSDEQLKPALEGALERGELEMVYQPQIDLASGQTTSAEALARWSHPQLGVVPPQVFVPLAEAAGLLERFSCWQLESACRQLKVWRDTAKGIERVSVNVSLRQLRWEGFGSQLFGLLERYELPPASIILEVSERQLLHDGELAAPVLDSLHAAGIEVVVDHFGTGNLPWNLLGQLPIDKVKIDRSLADTSGEKGQQAASHAVAVAHAFGLKVVATGAEEPCQIDFFKAHHCDEAQGYLIGRPLPAAELFA